MSTHRQIQSNKNQILRGVNLVMEASRESEPKEALYAEEVLAIFIRNQKLTKSQIDESMRNPKDEDFKFLQNYFLNIIKEKITIDDAVKRVQKAIYIIRNLNFPKNASQYGTTQQAPVEIWWDLYGGESKPINPKTDVLNETKHHSVKMKGGIQVLDAAPKQTAALCLYALDETNYLYEQEVIDIIESESEEMQKTVTSISTIPDKKKYDDFRKEYLLKNPKQKGMSKEQSKEWTKGFKKAAKEAGVKFEFGDIRKGKVELSDEYKSELDKFNKTLKKLDERMKNIWTSSNVVGNEFKRVLIRESMSGEVMFGGGDASANSILVWKKGFSEVETMTIERAVEDTLSTAIIPSFSTKSSGGTTYAKAKIMVDLEKIHNNLQNKSVSENKNSLSKPKSKIEEIYLFTEYSSRIMSEYSKKREKIKMELKEDLLNEETLWEKVKAWFSSLMSAVKKIAAKLQEYIEEIRSIAKSSVPSIFDFFGLEIDVPANAKIAVRF